MTGYRPPRFPTPVDLDLSRNEGRPTISGLDLTEEALVSLTSRYPDTTALRAVVARRHGLLEGQVLITAGGDDALLRCFLRARGPVAATTPGFEMIRHYSDQVGASLIEVSWWGGDFPIGEFLEVDAAMAVIVSPNNPTGSVVSSSDLRNVADAFPLVVLDAAYSEFADEDLTPAALEMGNVVVVRTLSKAFGLAGLRVGYLLGPEQLVAEIGAFGSPYAVSALSATLAADLLETGVERADDFARLIATERDRLIAVLEDLGVGALESQANFVLASGVDPDWVVPAMASLGIGLRSFPDRPELEGCVRITLPGDPLDFARLVAALRTVLDPEALLFDMDGVLADVRGSFRSAIVATAAGYGVEVTTGQILAAKAAGNASDDWELTHGLLAAAGVDATFEEVRESFEVLYQGSETTPGLKTAERLIPDRATLAAWSDRMPLGIVTARPRRDAEAFLERFGVDDCFATVIAREDAPSKPDPAPVRLALESLGVTRAWMSGDTRDDIDSARGAGVVPIGVLVPGDDPTTLSGAARIVASVAEIQEVLDVTTG
ncbi:MAG: aminotransferase class I/II-fold pyridoxal phosphate-dependent enzyme [Acidimicrobiia bacterium]